MIHRSLRSAQLTACLLALFASTSLLSTDVVAAVTFFGSVSPDPPGDGNVESTLIVGLQGDDDPDVRGYVRIDGGSDIEYDSLIIGDNEGYRGEVVISGTLTPGEQSRLTIEEAGNSSFPTVQVGNEGIGRLTVEGTGSLILSNPIADLSIGVDVSSIGTLTVTGDLSLVVIPDSHRIGDRGIGRMEILDGGMVHNTDTTNTAVIGANATAVGDVLIDGAGSIWKIDDGLAVGVVGVGSITVSNQGLVDADRLGALATVGPRGRLELAGGAFSANSTVLDGYLGGSGLVRGSLSSSVGALIDVPANGLLQFTHDVDNQGSIRVREGEAVFLSDLDNFAAGVEPAPGRISLESGRVRFSEPLANDGVIAVNAGANHLHGEISNGMTGAIVLASHSVGTFYDSVDVGEGTLELLAGANALLLADLTFAGGGLASLQVGDESAGSVRIDVSSEAALAGALEVELTNGYSPGIGDSFTLLSAAKGVIGDFDDVTLPTLQAGLLWNLDYGANNVVLQVIKQLSADFNSDNRIDHEDLSQWELAFGVDDGADANGDGDSDGGDFLAWQRQYGGGPAGVASVAVPELDSYALAVLAFLIVLPAARRKS